ncbi:hypothetical protein VNO77_21158 [Canavalia gladiata]|uniref:Uncharacterized protein n=1 Tax=Canavalia gladiata TaxID=3824 RepID=A0AAN9LQJ9_CANGL
MLSPIYSPQVTDATLILAGFPIVKHSKLTEKRKSENLSSEKGRSLHAADFTSILHPEICSATLRSCLLAIHLISHGSPSKVVLQVLDNLVRRDLHVKENELLRYVVDWLATASCISQKRELNNRNLMIDGIFSVHVGTLDIPSMNP